MPVDASISAKCERCDLRVGKPIQVRAYPVHAIVETLKRLVIESDPHSDVVGVVLVSAQSDCAGL